MSDSKVVAVVGGPGAAKVGRNTAQDAGKATSKALERKAPRTLEEKTRASKNFEKLVSAAYVLALTGFGGIALASRVTGLSRGQLTRARRKRDSWAIIAATAEERWLADMDADARRQLRRVMKSKDTKEKTRVAVEWMRQRTVAAPKVEVNAGDGAAVQVIVGAVPRGFRTDG